jgi:hypothetical protein
MKKQTEPEIWPSRAITHELFQEILGRIETGEMLAIILREDGMPSRSYFYAFMDAEPSRKDAYSRARLSWCDYWAEKVMMISLDRTGDIIVEDGKAVADHARIQRDRLITDNAKWLLGKWGRRTYGDRQEVESADSGPLVISWIKSDDPVVEPAPSPPKLLEYKPPQAPADLSPGDWAILMEVLSLLKRTLPSNSDSPPGEVFEALRQALLEYCRKDDPPPVKRIALPKRGRSGKT